MKANERYFLTERNKNTMLNTLRLWLIKKLLKDSDGYINLGFSENEPINFYYDILIVFHL